MNIKKPLMIFSFSVESISAIRSRNDQLYDFWRMEKGLWAITSYPHIFFPTPQNDLKKLHITITMRCTCAKNYKVFGEILSISISSF